MKGTMNKMKKNVSYIAIPNELLYHEKLNTKAKYLYLCLKSHSMNDIVNIKRDKLMETLRWSDNRTFLKYLKQLKEYGYIEHDIKRINKYVPFEIKLKFTSPFTQIDRELFHQVLELDYGLYNFKQDKVLLHLYVLECLYNPSWDYACPHRDDIRKVTKQSYSEIRETADLLHEKYICEFCSGRTMNNSDGKYRNRYLPNVKGKDGNRRYIRHKSATYFFK